MIHCDFPMSICSHSFSIQFPYCTSPKYGASPIMIPARASKVTMIGTMNFKYRSYGKLTNSSDPISVAPGYKEDTKFTPATNALIKMICPPALPKLLPTNKAAATAPKIGIVIPATPLVDCKKKPIPT